MPREARIFENGEIYHIIQRGIEDKAIFLDENDYYRGIFSLYEFNNANPVEIAERRKERAKFKRLAKIQGGQSPQIEPDKRDMFVEILAFCLMPNHIHLILKQLKDNGISEFMRKMGGYVSYFNKKYQRKGHLFQNRFKDILIKDDEQFKTSFVYIHTNPVSLVEPGWKEKGIKNLEKTKQFIENYKWSSYADYIGGKNFPSLTSRDFLLEVMEGIDNCRKFVNGWLEYKVEIKVEGDRPPLMRGVCPPYPSLTILFMGNQIKQTNFRIDDIGASTKQFEQYGKWKIGNFLFLKRIWPFKKWGPYKELTAGDWKGILEFFGKNNIKPIVAITACWVEKDSSLIPFPQKFPEEAIILKQSFLDGKVEIANHGLTHCVVGRHLPKFFGSNRKFHREFWPYLPQEVHTEHIEKSQDILEKFFKKPITIFVPPGNVWSQKTYLALQKTNIEQIISSKYMIDSNKRMQGIKFIDDKSGFFCLHDKDLKEKGFLWLKDKINFFC